MTGLAPSDGGGLLTRSQGLVRGGALPDGKQWPIKNARHRFVALAVWLADKTLAETCCK